jgi:hypothetical protein
MIPGVQPSRHAGVATVSDTKEQFMQDHLIEVFPDDAEALKTRLDELASQDHEIVSVLWQANRAENGQAGAYEARGSFVIVARRPASISILREKSALGEDEVLPV